MADKKCGPFGRYGYLFYTSSIIATVLITILSTMIIAPELFTLASPDPAPQSSTPDGTFYYPRDVTLNSTDHIFVADTFNNRIQVFDPDGAFIATFGFAGTNQNDGSLYQPYGIFINSTDFIHVANTNQNNIKVFNTTNDYVGTFGSPGTGFNQYYNPSGLTANTTNFLIADTTNNRIVVTDLGVVPIGQIPP